MSESLPFNLLPDDVHNETLAAHVHPPDWVNPTPSGCYNLVVIGAGPAGLVAAAGAAALGAKVALIERALMGGDCLNFGCVPSKTLLRSAQACAEIRRADELGLRIPPGAYADFPVIMERMRRIRSEMSRHDAVDRFASMGVDVFLGRPMFQGADCVSIDKTTLSYSKAVIATGARPFVPSIDGLATAGFLTNETVFSLTEMPERLLVLGGGPVCCELAQAFSRFGSQVTLVAKSSQVLPREDADAAGFVEAALRQDGVRLLLDSQVQQVELTSHGKLAHVQTGSELHDVIVDEILLGTGRIPNTEGLNLEAAGVAYSTHGGIRVDDFLRTTNPRIFAAGDICMDYKFTHAADAAARIVIQNALFGFFPKKRVSSLRIPWCTYTDPEVAHVGLSESVAADRSIAIDTHVVSMMDIDRAITDGNTQGFLKVHVAQGNDKILGATLVCRHAGDMIGELVLAMEKGIGLRALSSVIHPYPTMAECIRKAADASNKTRLTPFAARVLRFLLSLQR